MNKFLVFIVNAVLFPCVAFAQTNPTNFIRTDLIPVSPNAASIGKYGEVPMNLSTGSANYSIPLFTVAGNELSLPVTLNYSNDGYRPSQPVSWIGLGWSLNAGGVISRSIKDKVDGTSGANYRFDSDAVIAKINTVNHDASYKQFLDDIVNGGSYDSEPDIYSFNFGRYSGKFIKFKNKYYCFPYQKFKITGSASSFTIVTEDGAQYLFNSVETTSPKSTSVSAYAIPTYNSSFYLTKITNAANTESISLTYVSEGTIVQPGSFSQTYRDFISSSRMPPPNPDQLFDPVHSNVTFVTPLRLKTITSDKFIVSFDPGPVRADINQNLVGPNSFTGSARTLSGVTVTDNFLNAVKVYRLKQSYFGAGPYSNRKSLRLDSLLEYEIVKTEDVITIDTTKYQRTAFDYNPVDAVVRTDARTDHYGFYMGGGEFNNILIPDFIVTGGPDRSPNLTGTANGAMTKIRFPTGGYSTIEYELNKKNNGIKYQENSRTAGNNIIRPNPNATNEITSGSVAFNIGYQQTVTVHLERVPKSVSGDGQVHGGTADMYIYNSATSQLVASYMINFESDNAGKNYSLSLPVGNYNFRLKCDFKENAMDGYILYKELSNIPVEGAGAGGLRVHRITSYPVTGLPVAKTYRYTYENGFSSGSANLGAYDQKNYIERRGQGLDWWEDVYQISNSFIGESYYLGVPHYYSSVTESTTAGERNLTTRTDFKSYNEFYMGMEPVRVTQYRTDANNQLIRLSKTEYAYNVIQDTLIRALKPYQTRGGDAGPPPVRDYEAVEYEYRSAFKYPVSTRTTSYDGPDSVSTITYNGYDLAKTRNLLNTRRVDSKGRQIVTYFKYPQSYSSSLSSAFITANVLDPVWEEQVWSKNAAGTDSVLISSNVKQYDAASFKPVKIYTMNMPNITSLNNQPRDGSGLYTTVLSDTRLEERISFTYDTYGKIIRQQVTQGAPVSYRWGYKVNGNNNATNMIAECRNALETEFFHENFEETAINTVYGNAHTGHAYGTSYAVTWTKPNARAYLISYFYLSGGEWKYKQDTFTNGYACSGGMGYDDVSIFPADGQVTTYTYYPGIGVRSTIDAKGNTTYFEYDVLNRLKNIKDQFGNIVKNFRYHTAGNQYAGAFSLPYGNQAMSATFTRNNCDLGYAGSTVTYTVPASKHSGITQEEANAKAQADLAANGQAYANMWGTCTFGVSVE